MRGYLLSTGRASYDGPGWLRGVGFHSLRPPWLLGMSGVTGAFDKSRHRPTSTFVWYRPCRVGFQFLFPRGKVHRAGGLFVRPLYIEEIDRCGNFPLLPLGEAQPLVGNTEYHHLSRGRQSIPFHCPLTHPRLFYLGRLVLLVRCLYLSRPGSGDANEMNLFGAMSCCSMLAQAWPWTTGTRVSGAKWPAGTSGCYLGRECKMCQLDWQG